MTAEEIKIRDHLAGLSNEQLLDAMERAWTDLHKAAHDDNQGERHQQCFAACVVYCKEMGARGLKRRAVT